MGALSVPGTYMAYFCTIVGVLCMLVAIGKFFHKTPFRQIYDFINLDDEDLPLGAFYSLIIFTIIMWCGIVLDSPFMILGSLVVNTFICVIGSAVFVIVGFFSVFIPYMQKLHEKIVIKSEGKR